MFIIKTVIHIIMGSSVTAIIYIGLSYVAFQFVGVVGRGDKYIAFFLYIVSSCVVVRNLMILVRSKRMRMRSKRMRIR